MNFKRLFSLTAFLVVTMVTVPAQDNGGTRGLFRGDKKLVEMLQHQLDSLQKAFGKVSEKIYQQTQQQGPNPGGSTGYTGNAGGAEGQNADGSFDAEFTDKTGDNN